MPVEVGFRGFAGHSLSKAYRMVGITGANRRRAINKSMEAAEQASRWIWLKEEKCGDRKMLLGHRPRLDYPLSGRLEEGVC